MLFSLFLIIGVDCALFQTVLYTFGTKFCSLSIDFTILSSTSHVLSTEPSTDNGIRASFCGVGRGGARFSPSFPLPRLPYVSSWARFFCMCRLISGFGDVCKHSEILQKYWGNQCSPTVPPIHSFLHHCRYSVNLQC